MVIIFAGTHELQNISATCTKAGEIKVTGAFIEDSETSGVLIIVYSTHSNKFDIRYIFQNEQTVKVIETDLQDGEYGISVFAVREDGLPFSKVADLPIVVTCGIRGITLLFMNVHAISFYF